jgi:hypothetical protein
MSHLYQQCFQGQRRPPGTAAWARHHLAPLLQGLLQSPPQVAALSVTSTLQEAAAPATQSSIAMGQHQHQQQAAAPPLQQPHPWLHRQKQQQQQQGLAPAHGLASSCQR